MGRVAVIGGGIAGISAACFFHQKGEEVTLFEQNQQLGGAIQSIQKYGYTLECGPNTVLNNTEGFKALIEYLQLEDHMIFPDEAAAKNRFVVRNNQFTRIPASPPEFIRNGILSFPQKLRLLKDLWLKPSSIENENESIADFVRRRFGNAFYEEFINPFATGIYAGDPEQMSVRYAMKLLWKMEQEHGSVIRGLIKMSKAAKGKPKSKMFQLDGGLNTLFKVFEAKGIAKIHKGVKIDQVEKEGERYQLHFNNEEQVFDRVIYTGTSHGLVPLVKNVFLKDALARIDYVPVVIMHFAWKKEEVGFKTPGFGALTSKKESKNFLGVLFNARIFKELAPEGMDLFTVIIGGARSRELTELSEEELKTKVLSDLNHLLQVNVEPSFYHYWRKDKAIPQYDLKHYELKDAVESYEQQNTNFHIMGNFLRGVSVGDCIDKVYQLSK